jgi:phage terminase large subunit
MEIKATKVFEKNWEAMQNPNIRFCINQGGSRSSKTYSLCQLLIVWCLANPNKVVSIVRKTFPALRATVMRDFFEVLKDLDLYEKSNHNMSENIYRFANGSIVEFFSVDDEQKIRGRKRDIGWCNEANELWFEDFQQLNMRTES